LEQFQIFQTTIFLRSPSTDKNCMMGFADLFQKTSRFSKNPVSLLLGLYRNFADVDTPEYT